MFKKMQSTFHETDSLAPLHAAFNRMFYGTNENDIEVGNQELKDLGLTELEIETAIAAGLIQMHLDSEININVTELLNSIAEKNPRLVKIILDSIQMD